MSDVTFREKVEPSKPEELPKGKETDSGSEVVVEVPYLDYENQHGNPYTVEYFGLGDTWAEREGGFPEEISVIEEYVGKKIRDGEIPNTKEAVKEKLKQLEKINNLKGETRAVMRIETLAAYIKFLAETDKIKINLRRYGNYGR